MTTEIKQGQKWSAWTSGRQQWLLTTVTSRDKGRVELKYDNLYGLERDNEFWADEDTMLTNRNLFRFLA